MDDILLKVDSNHNSANVLSQNGGLASHEVNCLPYFGDVVHYYEIPRLEYVEKVIEIPCFSVQEVAPMRPQHDVSDQSNLSGGTDVELQTCDMHSQGVEASSVRLQREAPAESKWELLVHRAVLVNDRKKNRKVKVND